MEYGNDIEDAYKEIRDWKEEFFMLPSWPFLAGEIWGGFWGFVLLLGIDVLIFLYFPVASYHSVALERHFLITAWKGIKVGAVCPCEDFFP